MVYNVPVKNPPSVKLFKLKVKCWCYRDCISWRWPWLMWNMTWGKCISAQCEEIICEMLPLYQSLFAHARAEACVRSHSRISVRVYACVRVCICACVHVWYECPCIIRRAYMAHSAGGIGRENSLQKLLQQTETSSRIRASARWTVSSFSLRNLWNRHFDSLNVIFLIESDYHTAVDQERNILFVLVMAASCHCLFAL